MNRDNVSVHLHGYTNTNCTDANGAVKAIIEKDDYTITVIKKVMFNPLVFCMLCNEMNGVHALLWDFGL